MSTPEPPWLAHLADASEVCSWIAEALADRTTLSAVSGPVRVYQEKRWRITARFAVAPGP